VKNKLLYRFVRYVAVESLSLYFRRKRILIMSAPTAMTGLPNFGRHGTCGRVVAKGSPEQLWLQVFTDPWPGANTPRMQVDRREIPLAECRYDFSRRIWTWRHG
jgi:hypothetical protein